MARKLRWSEHIAAFWLNALYEVSTQFAHTPLHHWARKKLAESTRKLIPLSMEAFKEAHPEIASDPNIRYTFYPAKDNSGMIDVMCIGETGFSFQGALSHISVGLGLSGCVFHADANGRIE